MHANKHLSSSSNCPKSVLIGICNSLFLKKRGTIILIQNWPGMPEVPKIINLQYLSIFQESQFTQMNSSLLVSFIFYLAFRAASLACNGRNKVVICHMMVSRSLDTSVSCTWISFFANFLKFFLIDAICGVVSFWKNYMFDFTQKVSNHKSIYYT